MWATVQNLAFGMILGLCFTVEGAFAAGSENDLEQELLLNSPPRVSGRSTPVDIPGLAELRAVLDDVAATDPVFRINNALLPNQCMFIADWNEIPLSSLRLSSLDTVQCQGVVGQQICSLTLFAGPDHRAELKFTHTASAQRLTKMLRHLAISCGARQLQF